MILGLLTCSQKKLPTPAPAWLMYSASPRFSQQYQYLTRERSCGEVRIISAKYGLIKTDQVIEPYDQKMGALTEQEVHLIMNQIEEIEYDKILSLLSGAYKLVLEGIKGEVEVISGDIFTKAKALGRQGKLRRGKSFDWPINWILNYCI